MRAALPVALLFVAAPDSEPAPKGQVVDMVVARVNDAVITLSELVAQTGLVLLRTRGPEVATNAALTRPLLASVLDASINEALLFQEVRRLQLGEVAEPQVRRAYDQDRARLGSEGRAAEFARTYGFEPPGDGAPPPLWASSIRRQLAVEAFLAARARLEVRPSSALVLRCYEANADFFAGRPFADAEPEIRARIEAQIAGRTAERLVEDLRRRARVRVAPGFELPSVARRPEASAFSCPLGDAS